MSRIGSWGSIALAALVSVFTFGVETAWAVRFCGDYNEDQKISAPDALGALKAAVGTVECLLDLCDFNGDEKITASDALAILRVGVGDYVTARCPPIPCNGPDCEPTCPAGKLDCCDSTTCSGHGACVISNDAAVCRCEEGWVGVTCNFEEELYPFADPPSREPPAWTSFGEILVRPASYGEQLRYRFPPATYFVANATIAVDVDAGKAGSTVPLVFPDGQLDLFPVEEKATFTSDVLLVERKSAGGVGELSKRFPNVTIYRSLYEPDGSVRSVLQVLAVDDGGFVTRGLARHQSNQGKFDGVYGLTVSPLSSSMVLDDIAPVNGTVDDSTLLISQAFFSNPYQAGLFDDCDGLALCNDLCTATGLDQGDPGPACPPPPDPCEHTSPCGDGHGPGEPAFTHQCNDSVNNDGDAFTDGFDPDCDHSPSCEPGGDIPFHVHRWEAGADFGLFGDVVWCTREMEDWPSKLLDRGYYTETPFHQNTGWAAYDSLYKWGDGFYSIHEKLVRLGVIGCWVLESEEEADDCKDDVADCGPFAAGVHQYPYRFGRDAEGFWKGVKVDLWHARGLGLDTPLNAAQAVTSALIGESEAEFIPGLASVAGTNVAGQRASPHELGHSLNLTHCEVRKRNGLWTLMGNSLQSMTCPPELEYGGNQQDLMSDASGKKLHECFLASCPSGPWFGDPTP